MVKISSYHQLKRFTYCNLLNDEHEYFLSNCFHKGLDFGILKRIILSVEREKKKNCSGQKGSRL